MYIISDEAQSVGFFIFRTVPNALYIHKKEGIIMNQPNQNFSDLLSNRYKDMLKMRESAPQSSSQPQSEPVSEVISAEIEVGIPQPEVQTGTPHYVTIEDKLGKFLERIQRSSNYPSNQELISRFGFTTNDFAALSDYKYRLLLDPDFSIYEKISLQGEGSKNLFFKKDYAREKFINMFNIYIEGSNQFRASDFIDEMLSNLIYSETQSTFDLDNETNPRKVIENIINKEGALDSSEQLLVNIYNCYAYIIENDMSEEGLFELRKLLIEGLEVKPARRYRTEDLVINGNIGNIAIKCVPPANIDLFMKKLFTYIDFSMSNASPVDGFISSLVIHYYFVYISPYFEHNFILARLLSAWYIIKHPDISYKPLFLSEAIARDRQSGKYLKTLQDSFESGGDLTYFVNYLSDIISTYSNVYINLSKIVERTLADSIDLSKAEERAIKIILLFPEIGDRYFDWQKFKAYDHTNFSKQYYNRLLNHLEEKGILISRAKNTKLYRLDYEKFNI